MKLLTNKTNEDRFIPGPDVTVPANSGVQITDEQAAALVVEPTVETDDEGNEVVTDAGVGLDSSTWEIVDAAPQKPTSKNSDSEAK